MTGSIVKRGKTYSVVVYSYDLEGVKKQRWISGFHSKKEAQAYLRQKNTRLKASNVFFKRVTLSDYLSHWLENYSLQKGLAENTIRGYRVNIFNHIIPSIGDYYLEDISADVLDKLFDELRVKGLSGTSQRYVFRVLHKAFETGVKRREIPYNFCDMIETPKLSTETNKWLSDDELLSFSHYLISGDVSVTLPSLFALLLGLRRGEVIGLRWSDIDFENCYVDIRRTATPYRGGFIFSPCKTDKSQRQILLPDILINKLMEWRCIQENFVISDCEDFVFMQQNGKLLSATTLNKKFKKLLSACNLPDVRFHDLRHSFASYLVSNNVPITIVSQMLGHSKTSTTADIYLHADIKLQQRAVDVLNDIY